MRTDFFRRLSSTLILLTTNLDYALLFFFVFCHSGTLSRGLMTLRAMVFSACKVSIFRFRIDAAFFLGRRNFEDSQAHRKDTSDGKNELDLIIIEK